MAAAVAAVVRRATKRRRARDTTVCRACLRERARLGAVCETATAARAAALYYCGDHTHPPTRPIDHHWSASDPGQALRPLGHQSTKQPVYCSKAPMATLPAHHRHNCCPVTLPHHFRALTSCTCRCAHASVLSGPGVGEFGTGKPSFCQVSFIIERTAAPYETTGGEQRPTREQRERERERKREEPERGTGRERVVIATVEDAHWKCRARRSWAASAGVRPGPTGSTVRRRAVSGPGTGLH